LNSSERMKFTTVIFDLDGTLLDTIEDIADSVNEVLSDHGFPLHTLDDYKHFVGDGIRFLVERALPAHAVKEGDIGAYLREMGEAYSRNWKNKTVPYPGITAMLDDIFAMPLKRAVLSNKPDEFTKLCVQELLPRWKFDSVEGIQSDGIKKPDPVFARRTLDILSAPPGEVLYVGDTDTDMKTGKAMGFFTAGVTWGFRERDELMKNGADVIVESPDEITALLKGL